MNKGRKGKPKEKRMPLSYYIGYNDKKWSKENVEQR